MRLWTVVLEISVLMAQFPSREIAQLSYDYRTLGLGYANIGGLLMSSGIAYDSDEGRAYLRRAVGDHDRRLLCDLGRNGQASAAPSPATRAIAKPCCASSATIAAPRMAEHAGYEQLAVAPVAARQRRLPRPGARRPCRRAPGTSALELGEQHGYRNAQVTVVAPTGTIGLVMDCDTTGIEPDFALVKFKKLAGGGYFKIINRAVPEALARARLSARRKSPRSRPMPSATPASSRRPAINDGDADARAASPTRSWRRCRRRSPAPSTSNSCSTNGRSARTSWSTR